MHLFLCVLLVTYLSTGVSAFYPYGFAREQVASVNKANNGDKRRFYAWSPQGSDGLDEEYVPTLNIKKGPKVRTTPTGYGCHSANSRG